MPRVLRPLLNGADPGQDEDDQPPVPGAGKVWGKYVLGNSNDSTKSLHPFMCVKAGCPQKYTLSSCNSTKVGWHIAGKRGQAKPCLKSTHEDKSDFPQFYKEAGGPVPAKAPASSSTSLQPLTLSGVVKFDS